ncbi:hypothetical protein [Streptomyces roseochromogenus]|uniref:Uncharacterized protein n=1 Tax=Streptomyces roseochromogenus subsp. oscitans DS 12.976 TaxID=1352936 RepID=V6KXC9_STRRC|nr:hypothetical protein [Streptomyces roseochromogenus]EST36777.1 hypothetical protein M878_00610 [Streptomyces roseochromogenus subsp. oscitans DS 12.976]
MSDRHPEDLDPDDDAGPNEVGDPDAPVDDADPEDAPDDPWHR